MNKNQQKTPIISFEDIEALRTHPNKDIFYLFVDTPYEPMYLDSTGTKEELLQKIYKWHNDTPENETILPRNAIEDKFLTGGIIGILPDMYCKAVLASDLHQMMFAYSTFTDEQEPETWD